MDVALADPVYDRAQTVAKAYQEFRIKYIEVRFHFPFNTFQPGVSVLPRWWIFHDPKDVVPDNYTKGLLEDMGYKPRRAVGTQKVRFRPKISIGTGDVVINPPPAGVNQWWPQQFKTSPWLPVNMNAKTNNNTNLAFNVLEHAGIKWLIEDVLNPVDPLPIQTNVRVCFQFRKPVWYVSTGSEPPAPELPIVEPEFEVTEEEGGGG